MYSASVVDAPRRPVAAKSEQHTPVKPTARGAGGRGRRTPSGSPPAASKGGGRGVATAGAGVASSRVVSTVQATEDNGDIDVEYVLSGFSVKSKIAGVPNNYTRVHACRFF